MSLNLEQYNALPGVPRVTLLTTSEFDLVENDNKLLTTKDFAVGLPGTGGGSTWEQWWGAGVPFGTGGQLGTGGSTYGVVHDWLAGAMAGPAYAWWLWTNVPSGTTNIDGFQPMRADIHMAGAGDSDSVISSFNLWFFGTRNVDGTGVDNAAPVITQKLNLDFSGSSVSAGDIQVLHLRQNIRDSADINASAQMLYINPVLSDTANISGDWSIIDIHPGFLGGSIDGDYRPIRIRNGAPVGANASWAIYSEQAQLSHWRGGHEFGVGGPQILFGTGTPEGAVAAPVGSVFFRSDGGASTSFYVKESGTGNTGWVAK